MVRTLSQRRLARLRLTPAIRARHESSKLGLPVDPGRTIAPQEPYRYASRFRRPARLRRSRSLARTPSLRA
jgi:hypothetical protein